MSPRDAPLGQVTLRTVSQPIADGEVYRVAGTPSECLAMVWPLTVEVFSFLPEGFDAQSRLSRAAVTVRRLER